jgi:HK97 family phage portal protein
LSFTSSILRGALGLRADIGGAPAPWDDFWYGPVGAPSVSGMRVSAASAKRLATVVACVATKARGLGVLPCLIYADLPGGGKKVLRKHPLFHLLHSRPNDMQTAMEFYEMLQGHVELRGNGYAEILTSQGGQIGELIPMHPDRVKVELLSTGRLRYVYDDPLTRSTRTLLQEEVFHLREWADQRQVGQSRIEMGRDTLGVALAQQDYAGKFLKNDATGGAIITGTNFANKQDEETYLQAFERSTTGENRHRVKLLPLGVDIKTLGVKPSDMQLLEAAKASDVKICSLFNVLPHKIGLDTGKAATYASVEQFNLMDAQQSVLPMAVRWEQAIQRDLFNDQDPAYCKFSLASLLRGDFATRTAGYAVAIEHGWLSPDDVRELEDMNPISGGIGKQYFRPLNWTTLDAKAPTTATSSGDDQQDQEDEDDDEEPEGPGVSPDPRDNEALRIQLELLANDTAARCIRRETGAVRKMIDQRADSHQVAPFYAEHYRFVCGAFHFASLQALKEKVILDARMENLRMLLAGGEYDAAKAWIDGIAVSEPAKLAALAVEGAL